MRRLLTTTQIEEACRDLLLVNRRVGVREVRQYLRERHGASGRTARVATILRCEEKKYAPPSSAAPTSPDVTALLHRISVAEARAQRAEELERRHQDFWAARYAEKVQELEARYAAVLRAVPGVTADQYLRVCQLNAELLRRLAEYEPVEKDLSEGDSPSVDSRS